MKLWILSSLLVVVGLVAPGCGTPNGSGTGQPMGLKYSENPATYTVGTTIAANAPSSSGGEIASYAVSPGLPSGLEMSTTTGKITGTPAAEQAATNYLVTATNAAGSASANLSIKVNAAPVTGSGYTLGGVVHTQTQPGLVLSADGEPDLTIDNANGLFAFTFTRKLETGTAYNVSVKTNPTSNVCTFDDSSNVGVIGSENVTTISISCSTILP